MSTKSRTAEAIDRAAPAPTAGWQPLLSSDLDPVGSVLLSEGRPARVSCGYPDRPADREELRACERAFAQDWPGYRLGEWQSSGDGAEVVATVAGRAAHLLAAALRARLAAGLEPGDELALLRAELESALAGGTKAAAAEALDTSRTTLDGWLELAGLEVGRVVRRG